jgi:4-hydroxy-tetrahydrodipicolinate synthase
MMSNMNSIKKELWPVMLTPFTDDGQIDFPALLSLIGYYENAKVDGLFSVCQSSEMFYLSLEERIELAHFVKDNSSVKVMATGNLSSDLSQQIDEINKIYETGVDGVVLLTNSFDTNDEDVWIRSMEYLLNGIDEKIQLGLYECPMPKKHLLTPKEYEFCLHSNRFVFLKDTSCDIETIKARLRSGKNSTMKLLNANTATLRDSLLAGSAGYCGVMANFHPKLYRWLLDNYNDLESEELQVFLTVFSMIELKDYPQRAKYFLNSVGIDMTQRCRVTDNVEIDKLSILELEQMNQAVAFLQNHFNIKI